MIVLKRPLLTEQSMRLVKSNLYTFLVDKKATKELIAKAVKDQFNVSVEAVKVANVKGEVKQQRRVRGYYKVADYKKAIIKVKKGQKIGLFQTDEPEVEVKTAESETTVKEKKNVLKQTKVKVEKTGSAAKSSEKGKK